MHLFAWTKNVIWDYFFSLNRFYMHCEHFAPFKQTTSQFSIKKNDKKIKKKSFKKDAVDIDKWPGSNGNYVNHGKNSKINQSISKLFLLCIVSHFLPTWPVLDAN